MRFLLLALFATGSALGAQTPSASPGFSNQQAQAQIAGQAAMQAQNTMQVQVTKLSAWPTSACPVAFSARRFSGGGLVQIGRGTRPHNLGYRLEFANSATAITQARITLYGPDGVRVMLAGADERGFASEELSFSPPTGASSSFETVVFARKLTGLQFVELNELTYADGTSWHESAENPCRITPNGYRLIAAGN